MISGCYKDLPTQPAKETIKSCYDVPMVSKQTGDTIVIAKVCIEIDK